MNQQVNCYVLSTMIKHLRCNQVRMSIIPLLQMRKHIHSYMVIQSVVKLYIKSSVGQRRKRKWLDGGLTWLE